MQKAAQGAHANSEKTCIDPAFAEFWKRADTQTGGITSVGMQQTSQSAPRRMQTANRPGTGVFGLENAGNTQKRRSFWSDARAAPDRGKRVAVQLLFYPLTARAQTAWSGLPLGSSAPSAATVLIKNTMAPPGAGGRGSPQAQPLLAFQQCRIKWRRRPQSGRARLALDRSAPALLT